MKQIWRILIALMLITGLAVTVSAAETSGTCGENLTWNFEPNSCKLTISGTGAMENYEKLRVGQSTAPWSVFLVSEVVIEEGVTTVGNFAFYSADRLKKVDLPDGIRSIGRYAFHSCIELSEINASFQGLERIGKRAFADCFDLKAITLPDTLTQIGEGTFYRCESLEKVKLSAKMEQIPDKTFYHCKNLTCVGIPKSISAIGDQAFRYCSKLSAVEYTGMTGDRAGIEMGSGNTDLMSANWICSDGTLAAQLDVPKVTVGTDPFSGGSAIKADTDLTVRIRIYRASKKSGPYQYIGYTKNGYWFEDPTAVAGKTYYYKVRAVDPETGALSKRSAAYKITHKLTAPYVYAKNHGDTGKPVVTWTEVNSAVKYLIYRSQALKNWDYDLDNLEFTRIASTTKLKYHDKTAKAGKVYVYKVKAVAKNTTYSSKALHYDSVYCRIPTPEITVARNDAGKPRIRWEKVTGATEYYVYRCTTEHGTYSFLKSTEKTAFTDKTADAGEKYYYTVRAVDKNGRYSEFAWAKSITSK